MGDHTENEATRDWAHLSETDDPSERDFVTSDELDAAARHFTGAVRQLVDDELYVVATDAKKSADIFWEINQEVRETGVAGEQGYFGTRTRLVKNTLSAVWYKNRFAPALGNKKKVFSTHLKKPSGFRYQAGAFKGAKNWEQEAIDVTEDRYALLRQRSNALSKIRRALAEYERLLDKCYRE